MSTILAVLVVMVGVLLAHEIACFIARRRNRAASEALNRRHRIGL